MVNGTDIFCHFTCLGEVGCAFQTDGKGVQTGPPCILFIICFNAFGGIFLGYGGDDGTVQSPGEQYAVGYVAHQLTLYRLFQSLVDCLDGCVVVLHCGEVCPVTDVPAMHLSFLTPIVVSGQERFVFITEAFECFQLTCTVDMSILVMPYI